MGEDTFATLLRTLAARGLDLRGFDASAQRQAVDRRMRELGLSDLDAYHAAVTADADEAARLAERVFLGYTAFLRDPPAWRALAAAVAHRTPPVRAWSAGCGTGEEPYTLAMVLADALAPLPPGEAVAVLATDVDEGALRAISRGVYPREALRPLPRAWRRRYFRRCGAEREVTDALRACVTPTRHDLLTDPPPAPVDVVVCRHTLMYFHPGLQRRILEGFAAALRPGGVLLCEPTDAVDGRAWTPLGRGLHRRART